MPIIIENFPQRSKEWHQARAGNPGASSINKIITSTGTRSKQRDDYLLQLVGEKITGKCEETYQSQAMLNGIERESASRTLFELIYGVDVKEVGIVFKDEYKLFHASPDGMVNDNAVLELKNPSLKIAVKYLLEKKLPSDYFPQCMFEMYVCERELCYFMSCYEGLPPFIIEVHRDEAWISKLEAELNQFNEELLSMVEKIR